MPTGPLLMGLGKNMAGVDVLDISLSLAKRKREKGLCLELQQYQLLYSYVGFIGMGVSLYQKRQGSFQATGL